MDDVDQKISRIDKVRTNQPEVPLEVVERVLCSALVNDSPLHHQDQFIEDIEDFIVGLMNGQEDSFALLSKTLQLIDNDVRCKRIHT